MISIKELFDTLKDATEIISALAGFVAGIVSAAAKVRLKRSDLVRRLRLCAIEKKFARIKDKKKPAEVREMHFMLQVLKLYSRREIEQGTALAHLIQSRDPRAFDVLANRLGSIPSLSPAMKAMLVAGMRELLTPSKAGPKKDQK